LSTQELEVVIITSREDIRRFDRILEQEHYLGPRKPSGDAMRMAVIRDGEWVAVLLWTSAARRLKPRDAWIGWDAAKRSNRLKLVVQNSRFLVPDAAREPNMASRCLAAACRALPALWRGKHGYEPVLAETFTDPELFRGTCYRASGWVRAGQTAGFSRDYRDYYVDNEHPKVLWLRELHPDARRILRSPLLGDANAGAVTPVPGRPLPLRDADAEDLFMALMRVPDPRRNNRTYSMGTLLTTAVMAMLGGASDIRAIHRYAQGLRQDHKALLGYPFNAPRTCRVSPSYNAFYTLLKKLDPCAFADTLDAWYAANRDRLPPAIAMDGKYIGEIAGTLNLVDHATGRPVASRPVPGKGRELKAGRDALAGCFPDGLGGAVVSMDALHASARTVRGIIANDGEYLVKIKGNRPKTLAAVRAKTASSASPFLPSRRKKPTGG